MADPQDERTREAPRSEDFSSTHQRPPEVVETGGKADLTKRAVGGIIDGVAAGVIGMIPIIGGLVGTAYLLVRDGLDLDFMRGRSLGKVVVGLRPERLDGRPMDLETSVKRNWPFAIGAVAQVLLFIPIIGWILMLPVILVALLVGLYESYLVITSPDGRRMGDKMAGTRVVESDKGML